MTMERDKLLAHLQAQCSRREYCTSDIRTKIRKLLSDGGAAPEDVEEEILSSLRSDGFLSDSRYAVAFARDKASLSGWGAIKIRLALSAKGISSSDIAAALSEIDEKSAGDKMEKVLAAKYRSLREDPQWHLKLLRFGLGRGYEYEDVENFCKKL